MRFGRVHLLLIVVLFSICILPSATISQPMVVTDPIKYPLPSWPALCVLNGSFKVVIRAPSSATKWLFSITHNTVNVKYDIESFNGFYNSSSGLWTFYLQVPSNALEGLYSLRVSYVADGASYVYTQPKCVYVFKTYPGYLLIAHVSDTHLPYGADVIARAIYELNLIRPTIIVHTGDLVDIGVIASAWNYAWSIIFNGSSKIPILVIPGNHDHSGDDAANYQRYCGPLYYNLSFGNFHFIAMDTRELGYVDIDQLRFAENVLKKIGINDVKIMLIHHPIFGSGFMVSGSWQNINALRSYLYYTWDSNLNVASEFLRLVEQYNVNLVLAGHIHREQFNIYNGKYVFETNAPAGGSLPSGVYWSYRLVNVSGDGKINVLSVGGKEPQNSPSSYPIGSLIYYYAPRNDGSTKSSSIKIYNNLDATINPLVEFIVDGSIPVSSYRFYPITPKDYSVTSVGGVHIVSFRVSIPAKTVYSITFTAINETVKPIISVDVVKSDGGLVFNVNATDSGVGVKRVGLNYQFTFSDGSKSSWYNVNDIPPKIVANRDQIIYSYSSLLYTYTLSLPSNVQSVSYSLIAEDFLGNVGYFNGTFTVSVPKQYTLTIDSSPISGVQFTLSGSTYTTKFSKSLLAGNYTLSFPTEVNVGGVKYVFSGWSDGFSSSTRTITLNSDISLTVYYKAEVPPQTPSYWIYIAIASLLALMVIIVVIYRRR
ncbi:metallophosphoesterase [Candidatus Culexarchaeum yellowstonense]|uniref:metallophosphoesterase n=1 Tax=Candidatus Culexarchaeum yellowstonense TaxID=2928963 RepID=UPI0026EBD570|nr:metallophosphoesterase [Candidatus Culexarchaeum yellowstonense]